MSIQLYADVIIDISHENLDKTYQYAILDKDVKDVAIGGQVLVPFGRGNREIGGFIVGTSTKPKIDPKRIKPIKEILVDEPAIESQLIYLAYWMKETFGGTMNDSLRTVLPVKRAIKAKEHKTVVLAVDHDEAKDFYEESLRRNSKARVRLLERLLEEDTIDHREAVNKLKIPYSTLRDLEELGIIKIISRQIYRNPIKSRELSYKAVVLNDEQRYIVDNIIDDYNNGSRGTYLIHGVTGSGKTEVYMEVIDTVIKDGKQVIMLIPEIALTYQTVMRFYRRFGDRITIMNSKMSQGERYDQFERAKNGEIDIVIGPRSALFAPFKNLGLVIVDEEHESSYKSEITPKYHAIDVAIKRAEMVGGSVILGSATPSLESYYKAKSGEYKLYQLSKRAKSAQQPKVWIADLREELKNKNLSIFSEKLKELMIDRLEKKEQIMIFLNRRGYAGFVSCRSCGHVMKCPHCDISLTSHKDGRLICHYCGYGEALPSNCPECKSKYIARFGTGTQKVEAMVRKEFPGARVLRMDMDTTRKKGGHEKILKAFANQEADILVGTQMIVKGHDFPNVTLVGIVAADLSLHVGDFRASERTFQLLCQAAGRAGRDSIPGEVVIQTYQPEHYSVTCAADGDFEGFYEKEMFFREMMNYPPAANILLGLVTSKDDKMADEAIEYIGDLLKGFIKGKESQIQVIGPAPATLSKANDIFRRVIYAKCKKYDILIELKNILEERFAESKYGQTCSLQFDFNPMSSY